MVSARGAVQNLGRSGNGPASSRLPARCPLTVTNGHLRTSGHLGRTASDHALLSMGQAFLARGENGHRGRDRCLTPS